MVTEFGLMYYLPIADLERDSVVAGMEKLVRDKAAERGWRGGDFEYRVQDEMTALLDPACPDGCRTVYVMLRGMTRDR